MSPHFNHNDYIILLNPPSDLKSEGTFGGKNVLLSKIQIVIIISLVTCRVAKSNLNKLIKYINKYLPGGSIESATLL